MQYHTTKYYTKRGLTQAVRRAKMFPDTVFVFAEFGLYDKTSSQFLKWFMDCLHAKINRELKPNGKKYNSEYQSNLYLDSLRIKDYTQKRMRSSGANGFLRTKEMQNRFPHINNQARNEY